MKNIILSACAAALLAGCSGDKQTGEAPSAPIATPESQSTPEKVVDLPRNADGKFIVSVASDLPNPQFRTEASAEPLIYEDHPDYPKMVAFLQTELDKIENDYAIADTTTRDTLLWHHKTLANDRGDWDETLRLSQAIKANETNAAAKAMMFLNNDSFVKAMRDTGTDKGSEFETAYRGYLDAALDGLDMGLVQKRLKRYYRNILLVSPDRTRSNVNVNMAMIGAFTNYISYSEARSIVDTRFRVRREAHNAILLEALQSRIKDIPTVKIVDLWSERLVTIDSGTPVTAAIWDTGVDSDVMGQRMWTRPDTETRGNAHGLAFDMRYLPESGELPKVPKSFAAVQSEQMDLIKGNLDTQAGLDTPEADAFFDYQASLKSEDMAASNWRMQFFSTYIHGQHVADITATDNAAIQIMNIRMSGGVPSYEAMVENFLKATQDTVDYLKDNNARVVNMSWRFTYPMIEASMLAGTPDSQREEKREKAKKLFKNLEDGMTAAMASAPDILFIAAAGNEDENVDFVQSIPSGINLPNVMTVGAVDSALQPTTFTSFGKSIDVYANGYEIPARVPGGQVMRLSGTSMAAPQVANLAAKILSQNSSLSVGELRAIIRDTATMEGELRVIHPQAALAKVKG